MKLNDKQLHMICLYEDLTVPDDKRITDWNNGDVQLNWRANPNNIRQTLKAARKAFKPKITENISYKYSIKSFLANNPNTDIDSLLNKVINNKDTLTVFAEYPQIINHDIEHASLNRKLIAAVNNEAIYNDRSPNKETIERLIQQGADVNAFDGFAMQIAARHHNIELINVLVNNSADINNNIERTIDWCSDTMKSDPILGTACLNHILSIRDKNPQITIDAKQQEPNSESINEQLTRYERDFYHEQNLKRTQEANTTALWKYLKTESPEVIKFLLENHADPRPQSESEKSILENSPSENKELIEKAIQQYDPSQLIQNYDFSNPISNNPTNDIQTYVNSLAQEKTSPGINIPPQKQQQDEIE